MDPRIAALQQMLDALQADQAAGAVNPAMTMHRVLTEKIEELEAIVRDAAAADQAAAEAHFRPVIRDLKAQRATLRTS